MQCQHLAVRAVIAKQLLAVDLKTKKNDQASPLNYTNRNQKLPIPACTPVVEKRKKCLAVRAVKAVIAIHLLAVDLKTKKNDQASPLNNVNGNQNLSIPACTPVVKKREKAPRKRRKKHRERCVHGHRKMCILLCLQGCDPARGRPESLIESQGIPTSSVIICDRNHGIVFDAKGTKVHHHFQHCRKAKPVEVS